MIFVWNKLLTWKDVRVTAEAGWARFGLVDAVSATQGQTIHTTEYKYNILCSVVCSDYTDLILSPRLIKREKLPSPCIRFWFSTFWKRNCSLPSPFHIRGNVKVLCKILTHFCRKIWLNFDITNWVKAKPVSQGPIAVVDVHIISIHVYNNIIKVRECSLFHDLVIVKIPYVPAGFRTYWCGFLWITNS